MKRTRLAALHEARGAQWMEYQGWEIPAYYSSVEEEYQALQEGVGLIDLSHRQKLLVTGRDRRSWLHGQVTQDINHLPDGRGAYAALLNPQGHMVTDLRVFALPDALWLDLPAGTETPMAEYLDRYLIMERAEIEDVTDDWAILSIQGPESCGVLCSLFGEEVADLAFWDLRTDTYEGEPLYIARVPHCGEDAYDLFLPAHNAPALWGTIFNRRQEFAVHSVGWEAFNVRRVEAGIPWWGEELDPSVVPLEARLEHAIHFQKGCYVGQEIIARIHARGRVNNLLAGFFVHGDRLPARDTEIHHDGRRVGRVRTALRSLRLNRPVALGYLRREHQEPGTRVQAVTPDGPVELEVAALPLVPNDYPETALAGRAAGPGGAG